MALKVSDFDYDLPKDRIASFPLTNRDESKLLVYRSGKIEHLQFSAISDVLPQNAILFFNNTKVIPARLRFSKETGADIEVFLLEPVLPSSLLVEAMQARATATWKCAVGNLKRWTNGLTLRTSAHGVELEVRLEDREQGIVVFNWVGDKNFGELIGAIGNTPLPPYIKRAPEEADKVRYQTIYSEHEGAVAAPTAGLHFTNQILSQLTRKNIHTDFITLHVSAGTFQPMKTEQVKDHEMHQEQIIVTKENLKNLVKERPIIPVGTTSMRTLETLYWYGAKLMEDPQAPFRITQHEPYQNKNILPSLRHSIQAILTRMEKEGVDHLTGETSIFIHPGYKFKACSGLITNFHQPGSTLILLVAALIGNDWKKVYDEALSNGYRFLSYGDSSLLIP